MTLLIILLIATIALSFLCSLLESTLMSTTLSYITLREQEGYKPAARMKRYKTEPDQALAAILSES